jgi:hypothetical protein
MIESSRPVLLEASVADARMRREAGDDVEGEVAALELRVGVEHHGNVDGVGNGAEVAFDLGVLEGEISFEDGEDAGGAEALIVLRLGDGVGRRGRGNAGDNRHAAGRGFDGRSDDGGALCTIEIGELAGRAERGEAVHPGSDEIAREARQHLALDAARGIDGRDEIGKDTVEV